MIAECTLGRGQKTCGGISRTISIVAQRLHPDAQRRIVLRARLGARSDRPAPSESSPSAKPASGSLVSRFERIGVATLYGKLATSLNWLPGCASSFCPHGLEYGRMNRVFVLQGVLLEHRHIGQARQLFRRRVRTAADRSRPSRRRRPACAIRAVSEPRPVPTSSTTSLRPQIGRSHEQIEQVQVDQKILPMLPLRADARLLHALASRYDCVWRDDMLSKGGLCPPAAIPTEPVIAILAAARRTWRGGRFRDSRRRRPAACRASCSPACAESGPR